jgi:hypothetical protein
MGANKIFSQRRWELQQDKHDFQNSLRLNYSSWSRPHRHWSATGHRNQQPPKLARERSRKPTQAATGLHRSDQSPTPVRSFPVGAP